MNERSQVVDAWMECDTETFTSVVTQALDHQVSFISYDDHQQVPLLWAVIHRVAYDACLMDTENHLLLDHDVASQLLTKILSAGHPWFAPAMIEAIQNHESLATRWSVNIPDHELINQRFPSHRNNNHQLDSFSEILGLDNTWSSVALGLIDIVDQEVMSSYLHACQQLEQHGVTTMSIRNNTLDLLRGCVRLGKRPEITQLVLEQARHDWKERLFEVELGQGPHSTVLFEACQQLKAPLLSTLLEWGGTMNHQHLRAIFQQSPDRFDQDNSRKAPMLATLDVAIPHLLVQAAERAQWHETMDMVFTFFPQSYPQVLSRFAKHGFDFAGAGLFDLLSYMDQFGGRYTSEQRSAVEALIIHQQLGENVSDLKRFPKRM